MKAFQICSFQKYEYVVVDLNIFISAEFIKVIAFIPDSPEMKTLNDWFIRISSNTAITRVDLEKESESLGEESLMYKAFILANKSVLVNNTLLTEAEKIALLMYSYSNPNPEFYNDFRGYINNGTWEQVAIFSSLLYSAMTKLNCDNPISVTVYRGLDKLLKFPETPFFFPYFTSTSTNFTVAKKKFGSIVINFTTNTFGAKIAEFSSVPDEEEVLILPFESFIRTDNPDNYESAVIESAKDQPLLSKLNDIALDSKFYVYHSKTTDKAVDQGYSIYSNFLFRGPH